MESHAQSIGGSVPQTNMVPIGPTSSPFGGSGGFGGQQPIVSSPGFGTTGSGTTGFGATSPAATVPGFDPYAPSGSGAFGGGNSFGVPPAVSGGASGFGQSGFGPGVTTIGPPSVSGTPSFAAPPSAFPPPSFPPNYSQGGGLFGGLFGQPASSPLAAPPGMNGPIIGTPATTAPGWGAPATGFGGAYNNPNVYGAPGYPGGIYPSSSPSTMFPEGLFSGGGGWFSGDPTGQFSAYRLLRGPRLQHSYIGFGDSPDDLNIHDTDVSVIFAFPNFFYSTQPLYVVPSFSLHLWDGPRPENGITADLPANAYSAFLDLGWNSDPNQMFSTEFGVRVGAFSDFDTFSDDSIRVMGKAFGSFRVTPASTLKVGAYYLDRNKIKLLPAGGLLYQPNPYTRWDIFFPKPKFSRYLRTVGTKDVWWYLAGDYGGGAWTVERTDGSENDIDINDIRVMVGFESGLSDAIRAGRRTAFFEIGYVFDREIIYKERPQDNLKLDDGIMFRAGLGY